MKNIQSKALSIRFQHRSVGSSRNDMRHNLRVGKQPSYIDGSLTRLNSTIIEPQSPTELSKLCHARRGEIMKRKAKSNMAVTTSFIITFGHALQDPVSALSQDEQDSLYHKVGVAITDHVGIELTGLVAHRDEVGHHCHGQTPARHPGGKPMSKVLTPAVCSEIQTAAMKAAQEFLPMIERGKRKVDRIAAGEPLSAIYNRTVKQLHDDLPLELKQAEAEVYDARGRRDDAEKAVLVATGRRDEMDKRVSELRLMEVQNTAERKRLVVYEKRLIDREAGLSAAENEYKKATAALEERVVVVVELEDIVTVRERRLADREVNLDVAEKIFEEKNNRLHKVWRFVDKLLGELGVDLGVPKTFTDIAAALRSLYVRDAAPSDADDADDDTLNHGM